MKKYVYRKQGGIQLENHHPGCMWGALHILDYLAWRQVRKMLPYKRHGARRNNEGQGIVQQDDPAGHSVRSSKGSVRSRLKSRIVEDILRRKGKHHRSSTYPTQTKSDTANDLNFEAKDVDHLTEQDVSASSIKSDQLPPKASESKDHAKVEWVTFGEETADNQKDIENSDTTLIQDTLENAKQALLEQKLMSSKVHNSEAPLHQSKEFLDALSLVNLDKEALQGILQEQCPSHPFQSQQSFKMVSTPGSGSTSPKVDGDTGGSPTSRNKEKSQVAIRHFNILKRKLRHAIKESKKEKHHIALDGVLHKIPYGQKLSADVKEITSYWKERSAYRGKKEASSHSCGSSSPIHQKPKLSHFRRISSTGDSMEKYSWLYESSFKKKPDQLSLENSKETPKVTQNKKSLGRILSMPDLKSYYYIPSEYLNETYATRSPSRPAADKNNTISRNFSFVFEPLNERKSCSAVISPADELAEPLENGMVFDIFADAVSTTMKAKPTCDSGPDLNQNFEFSFPLASAIALEPSSSDTELLPKEDLQHQNEADLVDNILREPELKEQIYLQLDLPDDIEFKYVKNVLDLSGLSRNHPHESWHATDQPVDPAVFEEVEGYEEDSDTYNHLILFDLINEVLMEMYEKSFSYCPVPLSSLCRLRSMPKGDRVLNEVWSNVSCYFSSRPAFDDTLDYLVGKDLAKSSGWMNLQFDTECIGLELEDMIFDDLLDETVA